jgi:hypothetical protein
MTTLIIEIPDVDVVDILNLVKAKGGSVFNASEDEDLTPCELESLKRGLKEALLIKDGKIKAIPFSDLWNASSASMQRGPKEVVYSYSADR